MLRIKAIDVAELAGVSQSAVSRTFTDGASVSLKTREKVIKAATSLGYRPNLLARSLIKGHSKLVGLALGNLENEFFPLALDAISKSLATAGRQVLIFTADPNANVDGQLADILNYQVDALVLLSTSLSSQLAQRCHSAGIPVIFFNRTATDSSDICSVTGDNIKGAQCIAQHLIDYGYQQLAFMAGFTDSSTSHTREQAFGQYLIEAGRPAPARIVGHYTREGALNATRELLSQHNRPDAIFCANDHMALAAIDVARYEFNLQVGEDIGIVGFDNIPMASRHGYSLTSYSQPIDAMAAQVTQHVLADTASNNTQRIIVPGEIFVRDSTRRLKPNSKT